MFMIGVLGLLVALYTGLVLGVSSKLKLNQIRLKGKSKAFIPFVPLFLFLLHFKMSLEHLKNRKPRAAFNIMAFYVVKYPVVIGLVIEILLEAMAYQLSKDKKIAKISRKKALKQTVRKKKMFEFESDDRPWKLLREYKRTVVRDAV